MTEMISTVFNSSWMCELVTTIKSSYFVFLFKFYCKSICKFFFLHICHLAYMNKFFSFRRESHFAFM